jgi:predicted nucleic acid-binding protein
MRKIYLDVCCFNRLFDDQSQERIRLEAEAVLVVLSRIESKALRLVGSEVVRYEIAADRNEIRRRRIESFVRLASVEIQLTGALEARGEEIISLGIGPLDALHLACAEIAADIFLTTDDRLLKRMARARNHLKIAVKNPLTWLNESANF